MTIADKILKNLKFAKASDINHSCAEFLEGCAPVIAIHLANIINLSIKLDTFSSKLRLQNETFV